MFSAEELNAAANAFAQERSKFYTINSKDPAQASLMLSKSIEAALRAIAKVKETNAQDALAARGW